MKKYEKKKGVRRKKVRKYGIRRKRKQGVRKEVSVKQKVNRNCY